MTATSLLNHRYRVLKALGEGGFGKTYLAEDTQMPSRRHCVIKQLKPMHSRPAVAAIIQDRFVREAAVLETLGKGHDQIPTLYAYFAQGDDFYLVQEWIEGQALNKTILLASGGTQPKWVPWSEAQVTSLLSNLLPVLSYVHDNRVIHRDIKPDNIIFRQSDQRPCLIDFGAVKELMSTVVLPSGQPQTSVVIGTPGFMAPEQAAGRPTFASDLYSLGMTAIYLLTGRSPTELPTERRTGQWQWRPYAPTLSDGLAAVLTRTVHPYAQNRYSTAADMLAAIESATGSPVQKNPQPPTQITALPNSAPSTVPTVASPSMQMPAVQMPSMPTQINANNRLGSTLLTRMMTPKSMGIAIGSALLALAALVGARSLLIESGRTPQASNGGNEAQSQSDVAEPENTQTSEGLSDVLGERAAVVPAADGSADSYLNQAVTFLQEGRELEARQAIDQALAIDPRSVRGLSLLGDLLANQTLQDLPGAAQAYSEALAIAPEDITLLGKRCKAYMDQKSWDLALADCSSLLELDPKNAVALVRRGDIYAALQDFQAASTDYSQAIALNTEAGTPDLNRPIYYKRSQSRGASGDPAGGLEDLKKFRGVEEATN
jgi:serine/threonine protein kinase, bacterial